MSRKFPDNLLLGFSSSAYQIEGAWNVDGKGENIWDRFTHTQPHRIEDGSNGDVACDSYHKYKEDVKLIKSVGAQIYRFSLSWSRILPKGFCNEINQKGIDYYKNLIDELIKNDIEPMVTLYHWDLPQPIQDLGGWTNPMTADYFCDYAEVAFTHFGDKVKKWVTINEPDATCFLSYGIGVFAPGVSLSGISDYLAGYTVLKAHAKAYHLYDEKFRPKQKGEVGISLTVNWKEPRTNSPKDIEAAENYLQFEVGWFAHPIFSKTGDYPEIMKKIIAEASKREGYNRSRLPELDQHWIEYLKGTADFFGVNHYTTALASSRDGPNPPAKDLLLDSREKDSKVILSGSPDWERVNPWFFVVPWGFRKCLRWIKREYNNPKIYVTENGYMDKEPFEDKKRIVYLQNYLREMLKAIHEDGCRVEVYTEWSFMDNFEWTAGYRERFGLFNVDFNDPQRKRLPKKSVEYYRDVIKNREIPENLKKYGIDEDGDRK